MSQLGETYVSPFSAGRDMCLTFFNSWLKHCTDSDTAALHLSATRRRKTKQQLLGLHRELYVYGGSIYYTNLKVYRVGPISTTNLDACVFAKFDQFLPVRSHFDAKRPVNFFHIATFPSPNFGPLFAFHCPLFFTKNNNLECRDVLKTVTVTCVCVQNLTNF